MPMIVFVLWLYRFSIAFAIASPLSLCPCASLLIRRHTLGNILHVAACDMATGLVSVSVYTEMQSFFLFVLVRFNSRVVR